MARQRTTPPPEQQQPQAPLPPGQVADAVAAAEVGAAVGPVVVGALTAVQATQATGRAVAALAGFFRNRRKDDSIWLMTTLRSDYPQRTQTQIEELVSSEMTRQAEFERRMRSRLERDLPKAYQETDPEKRQQALDRIMNREKVYLAQRERAMIERAAARAEQMDVKLASPEGAYWKLDPTVKQHTLDCVLMGEKFWPWQVLDHIHPLLHTGCQCHLYTKREAVERGWILPSHFVNVPNAIKTARTYMQRAHTTQEVAYPGEIEAFIELRLAEAATGPATPQPCHYGDEPATHSLIWDRGRAYLPVCTEHDATGRAEIDGPTGFVLIEAAATGKGAMIALYPTEAAAEALAVKGGEAPDELHITLKFLGKEASEIKGRVGIERALAKWAQTAKPLVGKVTGLGVFKPNPTWKPDQKPLYAKPDVPGIQEFRKSLVAALPPGVLADTFPEYKPHITLRYVAADAAVPKGEVEAVPLVFDRVYLVWGDERVAFMLGTGERIVEAAYPLEPEVREARFDEHLHPRGRGGKWIDKGVRFEVLPGAVLAHADGRHIGTFSYQREGGTLQAPSLHVHPEYRRIGVATEMVRRAEEHTGVKLTDDPGPLSVEGEAWYAARRASVRPSVTSWHITDNPKFTFDPKRVGQVNSTLGGEMGEPGIFVTQNPEFWVNGHNYVRPFIAEIEHPEEVEAGYYNTQDKYLPAKLYGESKVKRVIPLDEYVREHYHSPGWIEEFHGSDVRGEPLPERIPADYRYTGPDVRDMPPEEIQRHFDRATAYIEQTDRKYAMLRAWNDSGDYAVDAEGKPVFEKWKWAYTATGKKRSAPLAEALDERMHAVLEARYTERLHPRGREGQWIRKPIERALRAITPQLKPANAPEHRAPLQERGSEQGRYVWLRGRYVFVPRHREFKRKLDHVLFNSPAGGTNIYRNGQLVQVEGEQPPPHHHDLNPPAQPDIRNVPGTAEYSPSGGERGWRVEQFTPPHTQGKSFKRYVAADGYVIEPFFERDHRYWKPSWKPPRGHGITREQRASYAAQLPFKQTQSGWQIRRPDGTLVSAIVGYSLDEQKRDVERMRREAGEKSGGEKITDEEHRRRVQASLTPLQRAEVPKLVAKGATESQAEMLALKGRKSFKTNADGTVTFHAQGRNYVIAPNGRTSFAFGEKSGGALVAEPVVTEMLPEQYDSALEVLAAKERNRSTVAERITHALDVMDNTTPPVQRGDYMGAVNDMLEMHGFLAAQEMRQEGSIGQQDYLHPASGARLTVSWQVGGAFNVQKVVWRPGRKNWDAPPAPQQHPPRTWEEFADEVRGVAYRLAYEHGQEPIVGEVVLQAEQDMFPVGENQPWLDHMGTHNSYDGTIRLGPDVADVTRQYHPATNAPDAPIIRRPRGLDVDEQRSVYAGYKVAAHEAIHGAGTSIGSLYGHARHKAIEEAITEELAHVEAAKLLREHGNMEPLAWSRRNPQDVKVQGTYHAYRWALDRIMNVAKVAPEQREDYIRGLRWDVPPIQRPGKLADDVFAAGAFETRQQAEKWVDDLLEGAAENEQYGAGMEAFQPILRPDLRDFPSGDGVLWNGQRITSGSIVTIRTGERKEWRDDKGRKRSRWVKANRDVLVEEVGEPGSGKFTFKLTGRGLDDGHKYRHILDSEVVSVNGHVSPEARDRIDEPPGVVVRDAVQINGHWVGVGAKVRDSSGTEYTITKHYRNPLSSGATRDVFFGSYYFTDGNGVERTAQSSLWGEHITHVTQASDPPLTVRVGDTISYDGRADGGRSEAVVVGVQQLLTAEQAGPSADPRFVIDAVTTENSLKPDTFVSLTDDRMNGVTVVQTQDEKIVQLPLRAERPRQIAVAADRHLAADASPPEAVKLRVRLSPGVLHELQFHEGSETADPQVPGSVELAVEIEAAWRRSSAKSIGRATTAQTLTLSLTAARYLLDALDNSENIWEDNIDSGYGESRKLRGFIRSSQTIRRKLKPQIDELAAAAEKHGEGDEEKSPEKLAYENLDRALTAFGAHDLDTDPRWSPGLYRKHPKSGFVVRNDQPRPSVVWNVGQPPRIHDTLQNKYGNEEPIEGSERPPPHLYRAISEEDYQQALQNGYLQSDGRMNLVASEGTVAAFTDPTWYLPGKLGSDPYGVHRGRVVKIAYRDEDGWTLDRDGYVKTQQRIPFGRIEDSLRMEVTKSKRTTAYGSEFADVRTRVLAPGESWSGEKSGGSQVPNDQAVYIAEGAMERAGQDGGRYALMVGHPNHPNPEARAESARMSKLAQEISGDPRLRVHITNDPVWGAGANVIAAYDPVYHTVSIRPDANKLSFLHEIAHAMTNTEHRIGGHPPEFIRTVHRLYAEHISPEAAETFWNLVGDRADGEKSGGEPMLLWHGTPHADVVREKGFAFTLDAVGHGDGPAIWLSDSRAHAEGYGEPVRVAAKFRKPLLVRHVGDSNWADDFEAALQRGGVDTSKYRRTSSGTLASPAVIAREHGFDAVVRRYPDTVYGAEVPEHLRVSPGHTIVTAFDLGSLRVVGDSGEKSGGGIEEPDRLALDRLNWRRRGPTPGPDGLYHVYHGTNAANAAEIARSGLRAPGDGTYTVTTSREQALRYAGGQSGDTVLHFALPPEKARELLGRPEQHDVYDHAANVHRLRSGVEALPAMYLVGDPGAKSGGAPEPPTTGRPFEATMYHGTLLRNRRSIVQHGLRPDPETNDVWLTDSLKNARSYTDRTSQGARGAIITARVRLTRPFVIDRTGANRERDLWALLAPEGIKRDETFWTDKLAERGYDGIIYRTDQSTDVEVFGQHAATATTVISGEPDANSPLAASKRGSYSVVPENAPHYDPASGEKADPGMTVANRPRVYAPFDPAGVGLNRDTDDQAVVFERWRDRVRQETGQLIRGNPIMPDDPRIPDTVYHATTNLPAVLADGYLRASGAGGLGGDRSDRIVSMTTDPQVAAQIAADLHFIGALGRDFGDMPRQEWNADTKQWTPDLQPWGQRIRVALRDAAREQGFQFGEEHPERAPEQQERDRAFWTQMERGSDLGGWINQWFSARASQAKVRDPLIFDATATAAAIDPDKVGVVSIPRASLDNGAILTDFDLGKPIGLSEIRSYGDVAVGANLGEKGDPGTDAGVHQVQATEDLIAEVRQARDESKGDTAEVFGDAVNDMRRNEPSFRYFVTRSPAGKLTGVMVLSDPPWMVPADRLPRGATQDNTVVLGRVASTERGSGVGTRLLRIAANYAVERDKYLVGWALPGAASWYKRHGFDGERDGIVYRFWLDPSGLRHWLNASVRESADTDPAVVTPPAGDSGAGSPPAPGPARLLEVLGVPEPEHLNVAALLLALPERERAAFVEGWLVESGVEEPLPELLG